jgi:hypothetical protein
MNRITYHDSIIADIGTYQKEFLPAYQQLVVPMVKDAVTKQAATQQETKPGPAPPTPVPTGGADQPQARASTSPTPPPSSNADLEKANQLVDEAVVLGSKLGFTNSIKEFYNNHKPYVDALVGAGKFLARFLGVPIP